jgi:hypothetical protein
VNFEERKIAFELSSILMGNTKVILNELKKNYPISKAENKLKYVI